MFDCVCIQAAKKLPTTAQQKDKFQLLCHPIHSPQKKEKRNEIKSMKEALSIVYRATVS